MADSRLLPAIKEAIKQNEIGDASPYQLRYAELGVSGASFGIFEGDTNVSQTARATLTAALRAASANPAAITRILAPPVGPQVSRQDLEDYLHATKFFTLHPRNFIHMQQSVRTAIPLLP